ncbi:unnamed protein product [Rhizophagus irregularis]|uniref:Uncharacterized protein n=1 Tax=Rhizophagus irregularis TaxID=588596 RepID=A0A916A0R0_9GLOM|nr:unnamed protein product [Rhizophagus irregularis]CAB5216273.1 unnamed protein product [Rhizophagus irregularis]CAB5395161.1 unnamed protein product [Rhizophagus irregularis]
MSSITSMDEVVNILCKLSILHCKVLFGEAERFEEWLKEKGIKDKDPISTFSRYLSNTNNEYLLNIWKKRVKITPKDLTHKGNMEMSMLEEEVNHRPDLAKKYLGKWVSCSESDNNSINLLEDLEIKIIDKNKSVILKCNGEAVGAVIRDAAIKKLSEHFGIKIKSIIEGHPIIKRANSHASLGKMVGDGFRANRLKTGYDKYVYKTSNPEQQKILCENGITLARWLFEFGKQHLHWAVISYEDFKNQLGLGDDEIIGAVFCTENYEAIGHKDNDRSKYAVGYVYEEGTVKDGFFFYPEYGIAIEMSSNSIWCWLTQAVHGTSKLDLNDGGTRYTAAITLSERTAKAIEKK